MFHVEHCFYPKTPSSTLFGPRFDPQGMFHVEHWGSFSTLRFFGEACKVQYRLGSLEPSRRHDGSIPAVLAPGRWLAEQHCSPGASECCRVLEGRFVGAKPRDITASKVPRHSSWRVSAATSAHTTRTRWPHPSDAMARSSASVRLARRSTRVMSSSGRISATTKPGTPAPDPRSIMLRQESGSAKANAPACSMTSLIGRRPSAPMRCASVKIS